jgi:L-asparaginase II
VTPSRKPNQADAMKSEITSPVLMEVTRGPLTESRHRGMIAVADGQGKLKYSLGDPEAWVCLRSLAKPFQALPVITTGAAAALGFGAEELALFSGSLSGQDFQVALVKEILARIGLTPAALQCGVHPPLHRPSAKALDAAGEKPTSLNHTCAGKHAAMLSLCVHHGWPIEDYLAFDHPVQRLILKSVADMVGLRPEEVPLALDGCGAPVHYVPLGSIAHGYARLAAAAPDSPEGTLMAAILTHPRHIAGDGRLDTAIMEALPGRVFAKAGSEGGYALAILEGGMGVAIKIEDGGLRAVSPTVVETLDQLGLITPEARAALASFHKSPILNHRKQEVGQIRTVFSLMK